MDLNAAQRAAVEHQAGPLLVVAGAGSGKTRVLTARVVRLVERGTPPEAVVAFTFTNRAAREMRERIGRAMGDAISRLWIGTFHSTGVRILRREARAGVTRWPSDFSIYDREDQEGLLREVMKGLALPEGSFRLGDVLGRISDAKNALVSVEEAAHAAVTPFEERIVECYRLYQTALTRQGALDFDDLIAEVVRLFHAHPAIAERYATRFQHVLVDEYQDTNHAQFRLVAALAATHGNLFVVGDDDQSIYGWRGADLANVLEFEQAFPGAEVVRLEQNYRSTGNILRAANAVIANNRARKGKQLWCDREEGRRLRFILATDEIDEARRIAAHLEERQRRVSGARLSDCAVLYRTNAQSRALETELRQRGMRYEIVGGVSFYQRREVKDVLAYLRVAVNPLDAAAFWRALNTPRRGLGEGVRTRIEQRLAAGAAHPLEALRALVQEGGLGRATAGATTFLELIDDLVSHLGDPVDLVLQRALERSGYLRTLEDLPPTEGAERRSNLEELAAATAQFAAVSADPSLVAFLGETALLTDMDRVEADADRVLLLTAHNAKGLEFPAIVIAGLEEGLFPHGTSLENPDELEEERRLFYVALTRARDEVLLTAAAFRRRFAANGSFAAAGGQISRFVDEIPAEVLDREEPIATGWGRGRAWGDDADESWGGASHARGRRGAGSGWGVGRRHADDGLSGPAYRTPASLAHTLGAEVFHETFGRGVVMAADGEGAELRFTVRFGTRVKKVLGRFLSGGPDVH